MILALDRVLSSQALMLTKKTHFLLLLSVFFALLIMTQWTISTLSQFRLFSCLRTDNSTKIGVKTIILHLTPWPWKIPAPTQVVGSCFQDRDNKLHACCEADRHSSAANFTGKARGSYCPLCYAVCLQPLAKEMLLLKVEETHSCCGNSNSTSQSRPSLSVHSFVNSFIHWLDDPSPVRD